MNKNVCLESQAIYGNLLFTGGQLISGQQGQLGRGSKSGKEGEKRSQCPEHAMNKRGDNGHQYD